MKARLLAVSLAALLAAACGGRKAEGPRAAAPPSPTVPPDVKELEGALARAAATPAADEAAGVLRATGELVPPVRSELSARLTGRVGKVLVDEGARVTAGQPMLELEDTYLRLEDERAAAEESRAEAAFADAERDHARKKDLLSRGSVAPAAYDRSESAYLQAKAALAAARAARSLARQRLADAVLRSPIDGVVLARKTDVGERVSEGTVTFVVVQTAPLKLRFRLPERFLGEVVPGASVRARVDPYPDEVFTGRVAVVVGAVERESRTFAVEAAFENRDGRLQPGLFARVELDRRAGEGKKAP